MKGKWCPYFEIFCQEESGCLNCWLYLKMTGKIEE